MKLCFVFDQFIYGGIERVGVTYVKMLREAGHDIDVYILDPHTEAIVQELEALCPVHIVPFLRTVCPERYWALAKRWNWGKFVFPFAYAAAWVILQLCRPWKRQRPQYDVAIAFSGHYNDLNFVARRFVRATHTVAWVHGAYYEYALMSQGYVELYRKIDRLIALSNEGDAEISAYYPTDRFSIARIYNPIINNASLLREEDISSLKAAHGDFLLMVARFAPPKDFATVIEAIALLLAEGFAAPKVVFVGDGPDLEAVKQLVYDRHLERQFVFEGTRADVINYYRACYALLHSSLFEGLSTVVIEALAEGKPVVATDSKVGVREVLGNNDYGLLCAVQAPADMAKQIKRLYTDKALYAHYQSLAKKRAADFAPEVVRTQLLAYFEELAGARGV